MLNPELKKGDTVICYHMEDEWNSVPPGTKGTVTGKSSLFGDIQYSVNWENGSTLALISSCDAWKLDKERVDENLRVESDADKSNEVFMRNIDVFSYFKMKFFKNYLLKLRECSVVNMFQAAPFLYMGKDRMELEFRYHRTDNEICDEVLDMANIAQAEMISGVIRYLEDNDKEVDLNSINRFVPRFATKVLENYMYLV
jgi:hypothetical protein